MVNKSVSFVIPCVFPSLLLYSIDNWIYNILMIGVSKILRLFEKEIELKIMITRNIRKESISPTGISHYFSLVFPPNSYKLKCLEIL